MSESPFIQELRELRRAFREATAQRNKTEADAETTVKKAEATRTQAEAKAKKHFEQQKQTVDKALKVISKPE